MSSRRTTRSRTASTTAPAASATPATAASSSRSPVRMSASSPRSAQHSSSPAAKSASRTTTSSASNPANSNVQAGLSGAYVPWSNRDLTELASLSEEQFEAALAREKEYRREEFRKAKAALAALPQTIGNNAALRVTLSAGSATDHAVERGQSGSRAGLHASSRAASVHPVALEPTPAGGSRASLLFGSAARAASPEIPEPSDSGNFGFHTNEASKGQTRIKRPQTSGPGSEPEPKKARCKKQTIVMYDDTSYFCIDEATRLVRDGRMLISGYCDGWVLMDECEIDDGDLHTIREAPEGHEERVLPMQRSHGYKNKMSTAFKKKTNHVEKYGGYACGYCWEVAVDKTAVNIFSHNAKSRLARCALGMSSAI
ncbi:mucin-5AC-like [Paramacrobiotus metropolitanus]|uniref:mucin-5AC-like n=1 Tax=Paramacrobiotus metropolitanus TaxID=2943436 RepID=UPI0024463012|nr:mucin-5AC-like [Paramacrobiotus metropolitanus]